MGVKKPFWPRFRESLQSFYYVGTLITLVLIAVQAFYAKRTVTQSSQWEKAKVTIENIDQFKSYMASTPMADYDKWKQIDIDWPDFETPRGEKIFRETIFPVYASMFGFGSAMEFDTNKMLTEHFRMVDAMDTFAYPIIMGYANEWESYNLALREFYSCGNMVIPFVIYETPRLGQYARRLYKLWRIRYETLQVDRFIALGNPELFPVDHAFCYGDPEAADTPEVTMASLKAYRKKIERMLKETQKEIKEFRKNNLKQN